MAEVEDVLSISEEEQVEEEPKRKKQKKEHDDIEAISTADVVALRETQNIFKSNLFALQLKELVQETQVNYNQTHSISVTIELLKQVLDGIPEIPSVSGKEYSEKYPSLVFVNDPAEIFFPFFPPSNVLVVGSFLLKTQAKPVLNIDVAVEIPQKCTKKSDVNQYRYFDKRRLYLTVLAENLKKHSVFSDIVFSPFRGDVRKPILQIRPVVDKSSGKTKSRFVVNVIPVIRQGLFSPARILLPDRSRSGKNTILEGDGKWIDVEDGESKDVRGEQMNFRKGDGKKTATSLHNNGIVEDMMFDRHLQLIHAVSSQSDNFREVVLLLKVWLRQREMTSKKPDTFNGFLMSMLLVHLYQIDLLDLAMVPYQMLRVVFRFVTNYKWLENGVFMKQDKKEEKDKSHQDDENSDEYTKHDIILTESQRAAYLQAFPVVFVDPSGRLNLTAHMTTRSWADFFFEAKQSSDFLSDESQAKTDPFKLLFLSPVKFHLKFDGFIRIIPTKEEVEKSLAPVYYERGHEGRVEEVITLFQKGFGNRLLLLRDYIPDAPTWTLTQKIPNFKGLILLGLLLSPVHWRRLVDSGPSADDKDSVTEFKQLWGSKAEVRRFRDGSIVVCTIWNSDGFERRHDIIRQIVHHLVQTHHPDLASSVVVDLGNAFLDDMAAPRMEEYGKGGLKQKSGEPSRSSKESAASPYGIILDSWEWLVNALRSLNDLPMAIQAIHNVSGVYKYTTPRPPRAHPMIPGGPSDTWADPYVPSMTSIVQFVGSGAWPDVLAAMRKIKTAIYIAMAKALRSQLNIQSNPTEHFLDVYHSGFVFRFIIFHPHEVLQVCRLSVDDEEALRLTLDHPSTATANSTNVQTLDENTRRLLLSPLHRDLVSRRLLASYLHGLHLQYPAFGPTARLSIEWFAKHMILPHYHVEVVELLVAAVFTGADRSPCGVPGHYLSGFFRVLDLLAHFDWNNDPLVIDFSGTDFTAEDHLEIRKNFENFPESEKPPLFITYYNDKATSVWTREKPNPFVFRRTMHLAAASYNLLTSTILSFDTWTTTPDPSLSPISWAALFSTSLHDYDLLIWLNPEYLPQFDSSSASTKIGGNPSVTKKKNIKNKKIPIYKNLDMKNEILVDFDPGEIYFRELEARFGDLGLLFYDPFGHVIGIIWKPYNFMLSKFQLSKSVHPIPIIDKKQVGILPNIFSILNDIKSMGEGIVLKVELTKNHNKFV